KFYIESAHALGSFASHGTYLSVSKPRLRHYTGVVGLKGSLDGFPLRQLAVFLKWIPCKIPPCGAKSISMAEQYIFTIENLTKAYGKREVLKNIWLAFYPGAKIGVIGSNGAGKSTLLRVMALAEKDFVGTARPADGITIGYVPQEPRLDETKDVKGNLEEAVASTRALVQRYEDLSAKLSEPL